MDAVLRRLQARNSLRSLVHMPAGVDLISDEHYLLLYEDLQTQRTQVLRSLLLWLGKPALASRVAPAAVATHWAKAPESLCDQLANCAEIRHALASSPCFSQQVTASYIGHMGCACTCMGSW